MTGLTKKIFIFVVVMAMVAALGWFGRKAWKHYTEKNLIAQAEADFAKKDLRGADLCLRRVLQIDPMSVQASRSIANLLDEEGSPAAVSWRIRVAKLQPNNVTNRYAWVETALRVQNVASAGDALASIPAEYTNTSIYHKLAGAVAWSDRRLPEAIQQCSEALQMDPTNRSIMLNLATIQLAVTNPAVKEQGRETLGQLSTDPTLGMLALHQLEADAVVRKSFKEALIYSERIQQHPSATFSDKVEYLQLLRTTKSPGADTCLASLKKTAQYEPPNAYTLARWMILAETPDSAYQWLCSLPTTTQTNLAIQLIKTDCQIGMKDWTGLQTSVQHQDWGEKNFYRIALIALAQRQLGDTTGADASWQTALSQASGNPQYLALLSQVTGLWGWTDERIQTLNEAINKYSGPPWAAQQLTGLLYSQGDTQSLVDLMRRLQKFNQDDPRLKNNLADLLLLTRQDLDTANRLANEAYLSQTNNPFFISTYAYSLLLQKKPDMALKVVGGLDANYLKIPSVAAYYGVIEAQTGHRELAREPLARAQKDIKRLLPEERDLVESAIGQL